MEREERMHPNDITQLIEAWRLTESRLRSGQGVEEPGLIVELQIRRLDQPAPNNHHRTELFLPLALLPALASALEGLARRAAHYVAGEQRSSDPSRPQ